MNFVVGFKKFQAPYPGTLLTVNQVTEGWIAMGGDNMDNYIRYKDRNIEEWRGGMQIDTTNPKSVKFYRIRHIVSNNR